MSTVSWTGATGLSPNSISGSVAGGGQAGGKARGTSRGPRDPDEGAGAAAEGGNNAGRLVGSRGRLPCRQRGPARGTCPSAVALGLKAPVPVTLARDQVRAWHSTRMPDGLSWTLNLSDPGTSLRTEHLPTCLSPAQRSGRKEPRGAGSGLEVLTVELECPSSELKCERRTGYYLLRLTSLI